MIQRETSSPTMKKTPKNTNAAMLKVFQALRKDGHAKNVVDTMQSRDDLYDYLDYHAYESKLDALFAKK